MNSDVSQTAKITAKGVDHTDQTSSLSYLQSYLSDDLTAKQKIKMLPQSLKWWVHSTLNMAPFTYATAVVFLCFILVFAIAPTIEKVFSASSYTGISLTLWTAIALAGIKAYFWAAPIALVLSVTVVRGLFLHLLQKIIPLAIAPNPDGISFLADAADRRIFASVSWTKIRRADIRHLQYKGAESTEVLELFISENDITYEYFKGLANVFRSCLDSLQLLALSLPWLYLDIATGRLPKDEGGLCLRVPLKMFAAKQSSNLILCALKQNLKAEQIGPDLASKIALDGVNSFTNLWLSDLHDSERSLDRELQPGHLLKGGLYQVQLRLARGGFSMVYKALCRFPTEENNTKIVALKELVPLPANVHGSAQESFKYAMAEVALLQKITHPNIISLLDCFSEDSRFYLVLEFVDGSTLQQFVIEKGPLPEKLLFEIATRCADVLIYLHNFSPPILHQDLSPDNFMINDKGIKLVDFSVACQPSGSSSTPVGKPNYMAPEQFRGQPTEATDLYQLGAMLYFASTGKDPNALIQSDPQTVRDDLSDNWCELVKKLTDQKHDKRFSSAIELKAAIIEIGGV